MTATNFPAAISILVAALSLRMKGVHSLRFPARNTVANLPAR